MTEQKQQSSDSEQEEVVRFVWTDLSKPIDPTQWDRALTEAMTSEYAKMKAREDFSTRIQPLIDARLEIVRALDSADAERIAGMPDQWTLFGYSDEEGVLELVVWLDEDDHPDALWTATVKGTTPYMALEARTDAIDALLSDRKEALGFLLAAATTWADRELERQAKQRGEG